MKAKSNPQESDKPDAKLLEMLVCPLTRTTLQYDDARDELVSQAARLAYPIRGNIPIMLASEARSLDEENGG